MDVSPFAAEAGRGDHHSSRSRSRPSENTDNSLRHSSLPSSVFKVCVERSASSVGVRRRVECGNEHPCAMPVVVTVVVAGTAVTGMGSPVGVGNAGACSPESRASDASELAWAPRRGVASLNGELDSGCEVANPGLTCCCCRLIFLSHSENAEARPQSGARERRRAVIW